MGIFDQPRGNKQEAPKEAIKQPERAKQAPENAREARSKALHERIGNAEQRILSINAKADASRREMDALSAGLDTIDPEWKQGSDSFNRDSGLEAPKSASVLKEKYEQQGKAFDGALSELGDANTERAVAINHAEAFDKHGVDLEARGKEIEAGKKELEQRLRKSDELTEGYGTGTRPKLEEYLALDAESQAIASGAWEKRPDGGWLPKEANVPDFMPNFGKSQVNARTGKYETDPASVAREIASEKARKAQEELNIRAGRVPGAF